MSCVAIDCEMVSTRSIEGGGQALARVAVVDETGWVVLDTFVHVQPWIVSDYLTGITGIKAEHLGAAPTFSSVRAQVVEAIQGRIVVGHALFNDLQILNIRLPVAMTRDTALYHPIRKLFDQFRAGEYPSLRDLSKKLLSSDIQNGIHDPRLDAAATMKIYQLFKEEWECAIARGDDAHAAIPAYYARYYC